MWAMCVCEGRSVGNVCVKDDLWAMCVCGGRSVGNVYL